ncbi:MAG TPA: hypothetical protein VE549_15010, partial [Myxococcaceae bacterium]|nr:hypothetical protein [Myxococcaceae bacterium]
MIIHPNETARATLRAQLADVFDVVAVDSRKQALDAIANAEPAFVIAHHDGFRRLVRDLEKSAPGAVRAVICFPGDETIRRELVDIAADGYAFFTVDGSPDS